MDKKNSITAGQLFCMLYVSHSIITLTSTPGLQNNENIQDVMLSAPIAFLLQLLLAIPLLALHRRYNNMNIVDHARYRLGKAGGIAVALCYAALFLYVPSVALARYNVFVTTTMLPQAPFLLLSLSVVATACYGAFMGLEALARASGFVFVAVVASLLFIFCALTPKLDFLNFIPFGYAGTAPIFEDSFSVASSVMEIATLAVLLPFAKGKASGKFAFWSFGECFTVALVAFFVTGILGSYAKSQLFPFYVASSFAEVGAVQRLDAFYTAVWTAGLFVKTALFLISFSLCITNIWGEKAGRRSLLFGALAVCVVSMILSNTPQMIKAIAKSDVTNLLAIVFFTAIPAVLWLIDRIAERRRKGRQKVEQDAAKPQNI